MQTTGSFPHLHLHTEASLLDGLGTIDSLMGYAKGAGVRTMAMTDHGTLAGAVTFTNEAHRVGIKPILGVEAYVVFDDRIGHLTLLADGSKGWANLLALNTLGHQSQYRKPAVTIDQILSHSDGLVCMSGCVASPFHQLPFNEAKLLAARFKGAFGGRFFMEHMFVGDSKAFTRPAAIAQDMGIRGVVTNDVHFPALEHADLHPILMTMRSGFCYDSAELYAKSFNEMRYAIKNAGWSDADADDLINRTIWVADKLKETPLKKAPHLPQLGTTAKQLSIQARGTVRAFQCLQSPRADEYQERLDYEIGVVDRMGFLDYFVILKDVVDYARSENVRIGPGRGSGAGSLLLYFLGITHIDPIVHGLQFERFLNPSRVSMPDVDIDFESERRDKVLSYAEQTFGARQIATYSRYSHKSLVRDLGRHFKMPKPLVEQLADGDYGDKTYLQVAADYHLFDEAYSAFLGQIRHRGKHAGGVIITTTPVPLERVGDVLVAAWSEGGSTDLSYAGIVKFDFLGLSVLTALRRLEEKYGLVAPAPTDGDKEFSIFKDGDLTGIFQFSGSEGIRKLTQRLQPESLATLTAINALYRPGALASGATDRYPKPQQVPDAYKDVLDETFGAIVYQEQVMELYRRTVNGTLAEADTVRKIIAKPKPDDVDWVKALGDVEREFFDGAKKNLNFTRYQANHWWGELRTHSSYSFNKSHATAYAYVAWECAWWKYHYRSSFYAEMLNIDPANQQLYVSEAIANGCEVLPPHVNSSQAKYWTSSGKKIYMPLSAIKFMGEAGALALEQERDSGGDFVDLDDFMQRVPKKIVRGRARLGLWNLGGYDGLAGTATNDELEKLLGVTFDSPSAKVAQMNHLGFTIPNKAQIAITDELEQQGYHCGIVTKTEQRMGKRGPYFAVHLAPYFAFWVPKTSPAEGAFVAVKTNGRGMATDIRSIG